MWYLVEQYFWYLMLTFIIGLALGWWATQPRAAN